MGPWSRRCGSDRTDAHLHRRGRARAAARGADGSDGLLRDVVVRQDRAFLRIHDEVSVAADLRDPAPAIMRDEELVASLQAAGLDVAALEAQLQGELRDALSVELTVEGRADGCRQSRSMRGNGRRRRRPVAVRRRPTHVARHGRMLAFLAVLLYLAASIGARRGRVRARAWRPNARRSCEGEQLGERTDADDAGGWRPIVVPPVDPYGLQACGERAVHVGSGRVADVADLVGREREGFDERRESRGDRACGTAGRRRRRTRTRRCGGRDARGLRRRTDCSSAARAASFRSRLRAST